MHDHELAMLAYVMLADLSQQKRQRLGRDKFLVLAAAAGCRAGWLDVAERCREIIVTGTRAHHINRYPTVAEAMRNADFLQFLKPLERFCNYERAEFLLKELEIEVAVAEHAEAENVGEYAKSLLARDDWTATTNW